MTRTELEDALRPTDDTFKAFYKRGYRTWYKLWPGAAGNGALPPTYLEWERLFPHHPALPVGLELDDSGLVTAKSTWTSSDADCDAPLFELTFRMVATIGQPTSIVIAYNSDLSFSEWFGRDDGHLVVLILAWSYALSVRWAEIIPQASPLEYTTSQAPWIGYPVSNEVIEGGQHMVVDLGNITSEAARWWAAVLAPGEGWKAALPHDRWRRLSPWSVTKQLDNVGISITGSVSETNSHATSAASFETALKYIEQYSTLHNANSQNRAALAAALLLPLAKLDNRKVMLHAPRGLCRKSTAIGAPEALLSGKAYARQFDRLLTLSANARGMKSVLGSIFYEPNIPANACGAWLQGTMAVLQSKGTKRLHVLARMFFDRNPHISYLWLGGIITGVYKSFLQSTSHLLHFNTIDLHEAAWTGTLLSFIQEPVSPVHHDSSSISRADECRLMFWTQEPSRESPPMYPYPPLGDTAIKDTELGVQLHVHCSGSHDLQFLSLKWNCVGGRKHTQTTGPISIMPMDYIGQKPQDEDTAIEVDYGLLDRDRDLSEVVTRNVFTWMREMAGFTVAERDIYRHEWIDDFDSEDDESVDAEGDGRSTVGLTIDAKIGRWMASSMIRRCNSI